MCILLLIFSIFRTLCMLYNILYFSLKKNHLSHNCQLKNIKIPDYIHTRIYNSYVYVNWLKVRHEVLNFLNNIIVRQ